MVHVVQSSRPQGRLFSWLPWIVRAGRWRGTARMASSA
ncbi:hypothetical protein BURCENBC7_AP0941 [Burkholderia cenocepacia BC7]|nr:hypothetical protein BURCENK562V_C0534 [Burkholderia cenocepacia K56-2Valvano]ERI30120.1 hypothetical protein BURCENBC7_AP0941 [Burkholderia cenocepacia BC7]